MQSKYSNQIEQLRPSYTSYAVLMPYTIPVHHSQLILPLQSTGISEPVFTHHDNIIINYHGSDVVNICLDLSVKT